MSAPLACWYGVVLLLAGTWTAGLLAPGTAGAEPAGLLAPGTAGAEPAGAEPAGAEPAGLLAPGTLTTVLSGQGVVLEV